MRLNSEFWTKFELTFLHFIEMIDLKKNLKKINISVKIQEHKLENTLFSVNLHVNHQVINYIYLYYLRTNVQFARFLRKFIHWFEVRYLFNCL